MADLIAEAFVQVRPDLSRFESEVRQRTEQALAPAETAAKRTADTIERHLAGGADAVGDRFARTGERAETALRDVGVEGAQAMDRIEREVRDTDAALDRMGAEGAQALDRIEREAKDADQALDRMGTSGAGLAGSLGKAGIALGGFVAGGALIAGAQQLASIVTDAAKAAQESEQISRVTARVVEATGGAAGLSATQVGDLATELSELTAVDDEVIQSAENILLTFRNIGPQAFQPAIEAALDLSTVLGTDLSGSAVLVGKALNDPIRGVAALGRAGVTFSRDQKELIASLVATGRTAEAQGVILTEIANQVGGAAEAARSPIAALQVTVGNLQEAFGAGILAGIETIDVGGLEDLEEPLRELGEVIGEVIAELGPSAIQGIVDLVDALHPLITAASAAADVVGFLARNAGLLVDATEAVLSPITFVGRKIIDFATSGEEGHKVMADLADSVEGAGEATEGLGAAVGPVVDDLVLLGLTLPDLVDAVDAVTDEVGDLNADLGAFAIAAADAGLAGDDLLTVAAELGIEVGALGGFIDGLNERLDAMRSNIENAVPGLDTFGTGIDEALDAFDVADFRSDVEEFIALTAEFGANIAGLPPRLAEAAAQLGPAAAAGFAAMTAAEQAELANLLTNMDQTLADTVDVAEGFVPAFAQEGIALAGGINAGFGDNVAVPQVMQDQLAQAISVLSGGIIPAHAAAALVGGAVDAGLTDPLAGIPPEFRQVLETLPGIVRSGEGEMNSAGFGLMSGVAAGIRAANSTVTSAAAQVVRNAAAEARRVSGAQSPSRLFAEQVGVPIAQGIGLGIEQAASDPVDALVGVLDRMTSTGVGGGTAAGGVVVNMNVSIGGDATPDAIRRLEVALRAGGSEIGRQVELAARTARVQ